MSSVVLNAGLLRSSMLTRGDSGAEDLVVDKGMERTLNEPGCRSIKRVGLESEFRLMANTRRETRRAE